MTTMNQKNYVILSLFCLSFVLRIAKLIIDPMILRDAALYLIKTESWYVSHDYQAAFSNVKKFPSLPLLAIKELMRLGYGVEPVGRAFNIYIGSLIPIVCFFLVLKLLKDARLALISSVLLSIHPNLISYSIQPLRETLYIFFVELFLYHLIDAVKRESYVGCIYCGIFASLSFFCRYEAVELIAVFIIILSGSFCLKKIRLLHLLTENAAFAVSYAISTMVLLSFIDFDLSFVSEKISQML